MTTLLQINASLFYIEAGLIARMGGVTLSETLLTTHVAGVTLDDNGGTAG